MSETATVADSLPQLPAPLPERFRCQCRRFSVPCSSRMTQEDLLCDTCRKPCGMVVGPAPLSGQESVRHLPAAVGWSMDFKLAP